MSPERFVKGESERTRKIHVDSAALTHRAPLYLRSKSRGFAPILRPSSLSRFFEIEGPP